MTNANALTGYYASRPGIKIDGQIQTSLSDLQLQSLLVEEGVLGLFRCEADFVNWGPKDNSVGFLFFDRKLIDFGKPLAIEFGPPGGTSPVFAGRITGIEAAYPPYRAPEMIILAEDRFQDLRMERRTRSFENVTDEDVIRQIASQHGLTPQIDVDGPNHRVLAQVNQSDLAFLRERAAAVDADLWVDNDALHVQARARRNAGSTSFTYGQNLIEFTVLADLAHQRTSVRVSGWDVSGKTAIDEEAGESLISGELDGKRSGSSVLAQALSQRKERIATSMPLSSAEAQKIAAAHYRNRARGFLRGSGVVDGNAKLRVGSKVDLKGLGPFFDGRYAVTLARHTFTLSDGYRTTFEVERPGIGG